MVEADTESSETDESWQKVTNQPSNKVQKTDTNAPTTTVSFLGQTVPQNLKTDGVYSYFSFGGSDPRSKPIFHQDISHKSSSIKQQQPAGESSLCTQPRTKKSNLPPCKLEFQAQQKAIEIHVLNDLVKHNDRFNVNTTYYSIHPQS
jgi:hypothetical protein